MLIPTYLLCLLAAGMLSKKGMVVPYAAGAVGFALGGAYHLPYTTMLFVVLTLYLTAMLANAVPESRGLSMDASMIILNQEVDDGEGDPYTAPARLYAVKVTGLMVATLLPLGTPPSYLGGIGAVAVISLLLFANRTQHRESGDLKGYLAAVAVQSLAIGFVSSLVNYYSDYLGGSLALICGLAIPAYLMRGEQQLEPVPEHDLFFGWFPCLSSVVLVWLIPGFSVSAVASSLFPADQHRLVAVSALEGVVEGYVLHLLLNNQLSRKTPLGDLLGSNFANWGEFEPTGATYAVLLLAIAVAILAATFSPALPFDHSPTLSACLLTLQGITLAGPITWVFIALGFACLYLRRKLAEYSDESIATSFVASALFNQ